MHMYSFMPTNIKINHTIHTAIYIILHINISHPMKFCFVDILLATNTVPYSLGLMRSFGQFSLYQYYFNDYMYSFSYLSNYFFVS